MTTQAYLYEQDDALKVPPPHEHVYVCAYTEARIRRVSSPFPQRGVRPDETVASEESLYRCILCGKAPA